LILNFFALPFLYIILIQNVLQHPVASHLFIPML
jgi:hypothetical protein